MKETKQMKKLMIAAAMVCAAAMSYGATASWNWGVGGSAPSQIFYANSTTAKLAENTMVYLFDAGVIDQGTLLANFRNGTYDDLSDATSVKDSKLNSSSKLTAVDGFGYGLKPDDSFDGKYSFYMAVLNGDQLFLSDSLPVTASALDTAAPITFSGIKDMTQKDFTADASKAFSAGGWYAASAVPEPTSGLLLLLGVAGLALRRRRA